MLHVYLHSQAKVANLEKIHILINFKNRGKNLTAKLRKALTLKDYADKVFLSCKSWEVTT